MKNVSCEIIQDILPLYHDHVCSAASSAMVEEHLKDCAACTRVLAEMDDDKIEADLLSETHEILKRHEKKERSLAFKTGIVIAGILIPPVRGDRFLDGIRTVVTAVSNRGLSGGSAGNVSESQRTFVHDLGHGLVLSDDLCILYRLSECYSRSACGIKLLCGGSLADIPCNPLSALQRIRKSRNFDCCLWSQSWHRKSDGMGAADGSRPSYADGSWGCFDRTCLCFRWNGATFEKKVTVRLIQG